MNFDGVANDMNELRMSYATADDFQLRSGAQPIGMLARTHWPLLAHAPSREQRERNANRNRVIAAFSSRGELVPLRERFDGRDLPARACPECEFPLPLDIDEREAVVIAVVGVNRVGKTHFLAASLTEAYKRRGFAPLGVTEFVPDESTATRFREDYEMPLFNQKSVLPMTPENADARFEPLVFKFTASGCDPACLVFHDVAGESLGNYRERAGGATFLRAARGIVFIIDPRDIDDVRDRLPDWIVESNDISYDQGSLLSACLKENSGILSDQRKVPVAITVSKADLLLTAYKEELPFLQRTNARDESLQDSFERVIERSRQVKQFLERAGAYNILDIAQDYAVRCASTRGASPVGVTYHAISAIGHQPDALEQLTRRPEPLNCTDPLVAVIGQILNLVPGERSASVS